MKLWKRNAVVAAIVLFVCAAVYLNWSYSQEKSDVSAGALPTGKLLGGAALVGASSNDGENPSDTGVDVSMPPEEETQQQKSGNDYFSNARIKRQQARDSALSLLEETATNNDADQVMRDKANASIQVMADCTVAEAEIENLVTAKGFADCVAFVEEDSASVVVSPAEGTLDEAATAKIMEIVMECTNLPASQIEIIPVE